MTKLTQALVRELLDCDYEAGTLTWRERGRHHFKTDRSHSTWNARFAGKPAFTTDDHQGYLTGTILNKMIRAHRIIYLHANGWLPDEVDHENGNTADNSIGNLRAADRGINTRNAKKQRNNTSGITGVGWDKSRGLWKAYIRKDGKQHNLGRFPTKEEAEQAVIAKRKELGGFTERHGK